MNKYNKLLSGISEELNIKKGSEESIDSWKARVVYSAIGQLAIASLYDVQEDNTPVSITHFKRRIESLYSCYISMYPELRSVYSISSEELSDEIYNILLQTGSIYHSPHRISASAYRVAESGQVAFVRGLALNQKVFRSGLGAYLPAKGTESVSTVASMFGLRRTTLTEYWEKISSDIAWIETTLSTKTEYLRTDPPFNTGYFKEHPDTDGRVSLLRTGMPGSFIYYFYRYKDKRMLGMQIPAWQVDDYEYRAISTSCLYCMGNLPPTIYHANQDTVSLRIQYLYPTSEQNLIRLYSWPKSLVNPFSLFNRTMTYPVFLAIKEVFEGIGYSFKEE